MGITTWLDYIKKQGCDWSDALMILGEKEALWKSSSNYLLKLLMGW